MPSEPKVDVRNEQPYVSIPIKATLKEWGQVNALVGEVFGWLAQRGVPPAGPLFYRYWVVGDTDRAFALEVGVPVVGAVPGDGRVIAGAIPAGRYATVTHLGHPDRLFGVEADLHAWAQRQGLEYDNRGDGADEVWGGRFEFFLTNPAEQPDPEQWSTQVAYLLTDGTAA